MDKLSTFLMIGCDKSGVHTEAVTDAKDMCKACIAFAERDIGPLKFMKVAEGLRDGAGNVNNGDLTILAAAKDTGKIEVGEIKRYMELLEIVGDQIAFLASLVLNFGQHASGDNYDGHKHNNYVDGDSVSQWKIYQITQGQAGRTVTVYPKDANERVLIR